MSPHEDQDEFADLLAALMEEHQPAGATEAYLVEELGGIININSGLRYAAKHAEDVITSAAPFEQGLSAEENSLSDFMKLTPQEVIE